MFNTVRLSFCKYNAHFVLMRCVNDLSRRTLSPITFRRFYCDKNVKVSDENDTIKSDDHVQPSHKASGKYQVFRDIDAPVILDVDEERWSAQSRVNRQPEIDEFEGINLESK